MIPTIQYLHTVSMSDLYRQLMPKMKVSTKLLPLLTAALMLLTVLLTGCTIAPQVNREAMPMSDFPDIPAKAVDGRISSDAMSPEQKERYRLMVGDQLEVRYLRQLEYSTTVTVGVDGTVMLPYIPSVPAEGKTIDELRDYLEQQYLQLVINSPAPGTKKYLIVVGDVLEIKFPFLDEYSGTVTVRPDGKISLPLIDSITVEGKSPGEVEKELAGLYKNHLDKTILVVNVIESVSNVVQVDGKLKRIPLAGMDNIYVTLKSAVFPKVYIAGEVVHPTAIHYQPMLTTLQAIISAGGITDDAELRSVVIVRKGGKGMPRYIVRNLLADIEGDEDSEVDYLNETINVSKVSSSKLSPTNDIMLRPFDVVIVPKTSISKVRDVLDHYIYDLFPPLRNSSIGFNYTKMIGTQKIKQDTTISP